MKGQSYTIDIMVALFVMVLLLTFVSTFTFSQQAPKVRQDAYLLAGMLMNPYPVPWNSSSVVVPGIADNYRLYPELLTAFSALSSADVNNLTGTSSYYFITVTSPKGLIGVAGTAPAPDAKDIHAVQRYAAYNGTIAIIEVITWE